jgi:hypothetical protein
MVDVDRQPAAARRAAAPSTRPLNDHIPRSASPDLPRQKHRSRRQTASLPSRTTAAQAAFALQRWRHVRVGPVLCCPFPRAQEARPVYRSAS